MTRLLLIIQLLWACSCGNKADNDTKKTEVVKESKHKAKETTLDLYDLADEHPKIIELSTDLDEISGLTFTDDERLFCHGDENGDVFQLDYNTGKILKKFTLGPSAVHKDFEDIAFVKDRFYMIESKGILFEFSEGADGEVVSYTKYKTSLSSLNNVEGLCYNAESGSLLLACKGLSGSDDAKDKAVYSFSLKDMTLNETPLFLIPHKDIKNNTVEGKFDPSGLALHPISGTYFMIAARGNTIIEISKKGKVINQTDLPESVHAQPEGIAFKKDGTLFISNEGRGKIPTIVVYPMKK